MDNYAVKLFESLQKLKVTDENKAEVEKIKQDIRKKDFKKALDRIEKIKNSNVEKKNKELYKNAADVNTDNKIDIKDIFKINKYRLGTITTLNNREEK